MNVLVICQSPPMATNPPTTAIADDQLQAPARRATLDLLADWVLWADKTVTF